MLPQPRVRPCVCRAFASVQVVASRYATNKPVGPECDETSTLKHIDQNYSEPNTAVPAMICTGRGLMPKGALKY